jgi:hypothetical protein
MHIDTFSESPELAAMRETLFYTALMPYMHARLATNRFAERMRIREANREESSSPARRALEIR